MARKTYGKVIYESRFDQAILNLKKQAAERATLIGNEVRTQAVLGMSSQKSGRQYRVPGTHRMYTASAPGEYPAVRTGALKTSVKTVFRTNDSMGIFSAITGTHLIYGMFLELGTRKMAPRPWLTMAYRAARPAIERILAMPWRI